MSDDKPEKTQDAGGEMTLLQALKELLLTQKTSTVPVEVPVNTINVKLDGSNYGLWLSMMETYLEGKGKLGYVLGEKPAPPTNDANYEQWKMQDSVVKGLILNSLDYSLVGNFHRYSTAKEVWDALATTFFDGCDSSQIYDLQQKVYQLKQSGGSLEAYYNELQGLWREIDFRRPNPMVCGVDIEKHNSWVQQDRVYKFLAGLDDRLDSTRADVIQTVPLPSVEQAYAKIRREEMRQKVMRGIGNTAPSPAVMVTRGIRNSEVSLSLSKSDSKQGKKEIGCSHCHNPKHTKETCFKLHGYPEWWFELKEKKAASNKKGSSGYAHQTKPAEDISHAKAVGYFGQQHNGSSSSYQPTCERSNGRLVPPSSPQVAPSHASTSGHASLTVASHLGGTVNSTTNEGHPHEGDTWAWY